MKRSFTIQVIAIQLYGHATLVQEFWLSVERPNCVVNATLVFKVLAASKGTTFSYKEYNYYSSHDEACYTAMTRGMRQGILKTGFDVGRYEAAVEIEHVEIQPPLDNMNEHDREQTYRELEMLFEDVTADVSELLIRQLNSS
jgi:hypothetical protein